VEEATKKELTARTKENARQQKDVSRTSGQPRENDLEKKAGEISFAGFANSRNGAKVKDSVHLS